VRRAAKVDANQSEIIDAMRLAGASVYIIGLPVDIIVGVNGHTALVEIKILVGKRKPKPAGYTDLQNKFMATWRGGAVSTITDIAGALALVAMLKGLPSLPE
jgi:hypothetical protein